MTLGNECIHITKIGLLLYCSRKKGIPSENKMESERDKNWGKIGRTTGNV